MYLVYTLEVKIFMKFILNKPWDSSHLAIVSVMYDTLLDKPAGLRSKWFCIRELKKTQPLISDIEWHLKFKCLSLMGGPFKLLSPCLCSNAGGCPSCRDDSQDCLQHPIPIYQPLLADLFRPKNFKSFDLHIGHQWMAYCGLYFIFNDWSIQCSFNDRSDSVSSL